MEVEICSWLSDRPEQLHKNLSAQQMILILHCIKNILDSLWVCFQNPLLLLQCCAGVSQTWTLSLAFCLKSFVNTWFLSSQSHVRNLVACSGWQLFRIFGAELTVGHGLCYVMSYCSFRPAETERVCEQGLDFKG